MKNKNKTISREGQNATSIFDERTVESDYRTLVPLLREGLRVLDVGCGTGAISKGIAERVGPGGYVIGIDHTARFIESGQESFGLTPNLELVHADFFEFEPAEKFDLIVAARVMQWLSNPVEALEKMRGMLKPGGQISILDYNHEMLAWQPLPPESMLIFYKTFLKWRTEAGFSNRIAEELPVLLQAAGFHDIEVVGADEVYKKEDKNFSAKIGIWAKVAGSTQMVQDGFLSDDFRLQVVQEYKSWMENEALGMVMKLKEVRGKVAFLD